MAFELTTRALVISYLNDATADTTLVDAAIGAAEDVIARECNRFDEDGANHWLSGAHTEYIPGENARSLLLNWVPVTAISSVSIINTATSSTTVTLTDLECDGLPVSGLAAGTPGRVGKLQYRYATPMRRSAAAFASGLDLMCGSGFGPGPVKVVYTGGYAAAPKALAQAAMVLAAQFYRDRQSDGNVKSEGLGDYSVTYADQMGATLPPTVLMLIAPYRRRVV